MAIIAFFDVDGTLETAGGPVKLDDIRRFLNKGNDWGIMSSRSVKRSREAIPGFDDKPPWPIAVCRVDMRAEELTAWHHSLTDKYPGQYVTFLYVADRQVDEAEAKLGGWNFCYARNFSRYVELL